MFYLVKVEEVESFALHRRRVVRFRKMPARDEEEKSSADAKNDEKLFVEARTCATKVPQLRKWYCSQPTFRFIFVCQSYNILHTYFSILNRNFKKQIPYIVCPTALRNDDVTTTAGMHITTRSIVVLRLHCFIHDTKAIS